MTDNEHSADAIRAGDPIIQVRGLTKTYAPQGPRPGFEALKGVDLDIRKGEIFALLGPNGAGKTTLINIICGIVTATGGTVTVGGHDHRREYRAARGLIGLVPQELHTDAFESVWATTNFTRGLFGKRPAPAYIEETLKALSLWDKKDARIMMLSGGMKRRVMIAKALSHQPQILFLDEPTAGVDVELRRDMWAMVRQLRDSGVTIILTTHYIEEAEEMADRIGVISKGELILVEEKTALIDKMGKKELRLTLQEPLTEVPAGLAEWAPTLGSGGNVLTYSFDSNSERTGVPSLMRRMADLNIAFAGIETRQSSLEEIFVSLVQDKTGQSNGGGMRQ